MRCSGCGCADFGETNIVKCRLMCTARPVPGGWCEVQWLWVRRFWGDERCADVDDGCADGARPLPLPLVVLPALHRLLQAPAKGTEDIECMLLLSRVYGTNLGFRGKSRKRVNIRKGMPCILLHATIHRDGKNDNVRMEVCVSLFSTPEKRCKGCLVSMQPWVVRKLCV